MFVNLASGDLRLMPASPCVDAGNNFADTNPVVPGIQFIGPLDLGAKPRRVDADGDGNAQIDMGAYEVQR